VKKLTLGQIIDGIKKRDNKVLTFIYKEVFPAVRYYVISNGGNQDDAKDVFQESIIIAFKQISDNKIEIKTSFDAYLYGTSRLIWLKILRNKKIHDKNISKIKESENNNPVDEGVIDEDMEMRLYRKHFRRLGEECQKVLQMTLDNIPYEEIAKIMSYKSEKIVRNKKYKCKETLIKMIKADPEFKSIKKQ
jgi:RNA polymerase sigma factor (sigma-70 family)